MANPNILNISSIYGQTGYVIPSTTAANTTWQYANGTALTGLTPAAGTVNRLISLVATNATANVATVNVSINNATAGSGIPFRIAAQISVPGTSSLVLVDKLSPIYITEYQSLVVTSSVANAIEFVASFEQIT